MPTRTAARRRGKYMLATTALVIGQTAGKYQGLKKSDRSCQFGQEASRFVYAKKRPYLTCRKRGWGGMTVSGCSIQGFPFFLYTLAASSNAPSPRQTIHTDCALPTPKKVSCLPLLMAYLSLGVGSGSPKFFPSHSSMGHRRW